ncbi:hypothetical protein AD998_01225 [bacterium 336/3]|nr:hypothetical protein AD998_01225 [bacterium 336/3]
MKKYLILASLLLFIVDVAIAQKKVKNSAKSSITPNLELENSVFWEISGKGIKEPSYLFGTHHLYPPDSVKKNEFIKEKIRKSKTVIGEIALDNMMATSMAMMKVAIMQDTTLKDLLGEKKFNQVDEYLQTNMGMSAALFNKMRPMMLIQMISVKKISKELGLDENKMMSGDPSNSLDGYFQTYGKSLEKEIIGLETVELQANVLLKGSSLQRQAEMLMEVIEDKGSQSSESMKKLNKYYAEQNLNELAKFGLDDKNMKPEEYNSLLKNRNDAWMPQIYKLVQEKPVFIAVGALHLVGKDGLIYQLRKQGYTVKPLKTKI